MPETCENCGREIGKLETPMIHGDHVVCVECFNRITPQNLAYATPSGGRDVQVIEQTGKRYKVQMLVGIAVFLAGVATAVAGAATGHGAGSPVIGVAATLAIGGMIWYFGANFLAWWNHG